MLGETPGTASGAAGHPGRAHGPRVYLHIGEPKTGTTFLQHTMWVNREGLAAQGVILPGYAQRDHYRASRDLRDAAREPTDPEPPWKGDWDVLIRQAMHAPKAAVISDEILAACNPPQANRAVTSLLPSAEVHVILAVRAFSTLLPAEWQETIKCRKTVPWEEWLDSVVEATPHADRRRRSWFWAAHDTLAILGMWSRHIPPDHLHVMTLPQGGPPGALWGRFASILGVDPSRADLSQAPANPSLGPAEAEFLRRLNLAIPPDVPEWFYKQSVKRMLAPEVLGSRPRQNGWALPATRETWVAEQSQILVDALRESKYDIVGDLGDLAYRPAAGHLPGLLGPSDEEMLDAAVDASAALTHRLYLVRRRLPEQSPRRRLGPPRKALSRMTWAMLNGPRAKRVLAGSSSHAVARSLRVVIWRVLIRPGRS